MNINYGELIQRALEEKYTLGNLFNVDRKTIAQTTTFYMLDKPSVQTGAPTSPAGTCNGYPVNCSSISELAVTADYPIWVNDLYTGCVIENLGQNVVESQVANTTQYFVREEIKKGLETISTDFPTIEADDTHTAVGQVTEMIKQLVGQGYAPSSAILVYNFGLMAKFLEEDLNCCDYQVMNTGKLKTVEGRLQLKGAYYVEDALMPTDVEALLYVKAYALFNRWCETPVYFTNSSSDNYIGAAYLIKGKEYVGFAMYDSTNAGVALVEATVPGGGTIPQTAEAKRAKVQADTKAKKAEEAEKAEVATKK